MEWRPHPRFDGVEVKMVHGGMRPDEFSQMLVRIEPNGGAIPPHTHDGLDECFVILEGDGVATVRGRQVLVSVGTSIYAPEGAEHATRNDSNEPLILLANFVPAVHFVPPSLDDS
jgi:mannose-6-phosphate isomerase-like protein (cupin superfamily)